MILGLDLVAHPDPPAASGDRNIIRAAYFRFLDMEQVGLHDLAGLARQNLEKLLSNIDHHMGAREHIQNVVSATFGTGHYDNSALLTDAGIFLPDTMMKKGDVCMPSLAGLI